LQSECSQCGNTVSECQGREVDVETSTSSCGLQNGECVPKFVNASFEFNWRIEDSTYWTSGFPTSNTFYKMVLGCAGDKDDDHELVLSEHPNLVTTRTVKGFSTGNAAIVGFLPPVTDRDWCGAPYNVATLINVADGDLYEHLGVISFVSPSGDEGRKASVDMDKIKVLDTTAATTIAFRIKHQLSEKKEKWINFKTRTLEITVLPGTCVQGDATEFREHPFFESSKELEIRSPEKMVLIGVGDCGCIMDGGSNDATSKREKFNSHHIDAALHTLDEVKSLCISNKACAGFSFNENNS
jgi:hypothetical protein